MFRKHHPPAGSQPGTLMVTAHAARPVVHVIKYGPEQLDERPLHAVSELDGLLEAGTVCWIDVQGLGDEKLLRELAAKFSIHPLALEDVVNVPGRPKAEHFEAHTLCLTRMVRFVEDELIAEQVTVFVGDNYVLTFQERVGDVFDPVRKRIRQDGPILRHSGTSYLAYALLDAVIDGYYPVLERIGEQLEDAEEEILTHPQKELLPEIHRVKRDLLALRRAIWPQRDALNTLIRDDDPHFTSLARTYLRDCYDHCVQIIDAVDTYRELSGGLADMYLSMLSNRQNEVMKVLTMMASIFIPLSFLAGVYGMNFQHMPELHARWGYPILLSVMVLVTVGMIVFFRRKGWIGVGRGRRLRRHR